MLKTLAIDNYKCFQKFQIDFARRNSVLLLGKNGAGKSALVECLTILRSIAQGEGRLLALLSQGSTTAWADDRHMSFSLEAEIDYCPYAYSLELELPQGFNTWRVSRETAAMDGKSIYSRELAHVTLASGSGFDLDWHTVAMPMIYESSTTTPLFVLKNWLADMVLLRPDPRHMRDNSDTHSGYLDADCKDFPSWLLALLGQDFSLFEDLRKYVQDFLPDFIALKSCRNGMYGNRPEVTFHGCKRDVPFSQLSDGEKIFILQGTILALSSRRKNMTVFWDEPDNYISRGEVQSFTTELRAAFARQGQIIITSHSLAASSAFSKESALVLTRKNHTSSPVVKNIPSEADFHEFIDDLDTGVY